MSITRVAGLFLLACALSGCVVLPPRGGGYGHGGYQSGDRSDADRGGPSLRGQVWIDGFWDWRFGRRVWVDGHWAVPRGGRGRR